MLIKKEPFKRYLILSAFFIYIILSISVVFFPVAYQSKGFDMEYNFIPFKTIRGYILSDRESNMKGLLGNLLLTVPWGVLFKMEFTKSSTKKFWLSTVLLCVGIETSQHIISLFLGYRYRCVDIDDFILNLTGAAIGYCLYTVFFNKIYDKYFK